MNKTQTSFGREAKDKLKNGIKIVNDAVSTTMGPFGRNVLYMDDYGSPKSTKDGVSVAKMINELEDPIENLGAQIIKQAAIKTVDQAGDGTTTSTVLAYSISTQALDAASYPGINVTELKRGIENTSQKVINELKKQSKQIENSNQLKQIATLSANGDEEIGNLVTEALDKVGRDGVVTVEESRTGENSLEIVEGIQFDRGYKSPYFVTDNNSMQSVLNDTLILIYEKRINNMKDILPILNSVSTQNKSLLIIAEDIADEALSVLIVNKMRGILKVCAVKAPDFGERRTLILEDIAVLTGGKVVSPDKGMKLDKFNQDWFGEARIVTIGRDTTTIVDGKGEDEQIKQRIDELKNQLENTQSNYEREKLQERLAKMVGGVAIINVGGGNELEIKERKDRVDDALNATKAALEEGILQGSGVALLDAVAEISSKTIGNVSKDYLLGRDIIFRACKVPFIQILSNANIEPYEWIYKVGGNGVLNISEGKLVNAYNSGIIDPTKVVRCALQNAVAASTTLLLTECVIFNKKEDKKEDLAESFA